jgi:hypothetical protein
MESPFLNSRVKYYLAKKIIREKDFVIERGAIRLENGNRTAFLKRHYKNGQWYYAETCKKDPEPNFRPVQESTIEHLRTYYAHSNNLHTALNAIRKPNMDKNKIENPIRI